MVDLTGLQSRIDALTAQVATTETVEASAKAALVGAAEAQSQAIKEAVTAALTADNAADQGSIDAAMAAIDPITARFVASASDLALAVPANTTPGNSTQPSA